MSDVRGPAPPPSANDQNGREWHMRLGWGNRNLQVRGFGVLVLLALFAVVGSNLYAGFRVEKLIERQTQILARDHRLIGRGQEQATCILALTVEERLRFREDRRPDAWVQWCWWLTARTPERMGE